MAGALPDELWRQILEIGARNSSITYKDLCCLSISCSHLRRLSDDDSIWRASVALNVWQPQAVKGRHKQVVEQCSVPVESQLHSLEMEIKLCRQQIAGFQKTYKDEKLRLEAAEKELESMKYHPLQDVNCSSGVREGSKLSIKRKRSKRSIACPE